MSSSLRPHGLQHSRLPCPSPSPRFAQIHVHWVSDAIQPSCPLPSPSLPAFNLSQHQGLFQWVSSLHPVAKVLELQHQPFQWIFRVDFLGDWLVWSHCSPSDSQESSPAPVFFSAQPSSWSNSHIHSWLLKKPWLLLYRPLLAKGCLCFLICCLGWSQLFFQRTSIFYFHGCNHHLQWFWSPRK